jgi:hypothetical protein
LRKNARAGKGESQEERYLRSFIAMADRGLFSFDIDSYLGPNTAYFRVALPGLASMPLRPPGSYPRCSGTNDHQRSAAEAEVADSLRTNAGSIG